MNLKTTIQQQANQCVKCGLCLPHCPTYRITENECESPRGRIALMDGYVSGRLPLTAKLKTYLDHCLTCRFCETVCPAQVPYGNLIDNARTAFVPNKLPRSLQWALRFPGLMQLAAWAIWCYQRLGLQFLAQKTKLGRFVPLLPKPKRWREFYSAQNSEQGQVALFTGCVSNMVDQVTLSAAIKLLTACGYSVSIPRQQRCCGALHQHAGYAEAEQFTALNQAVFAQKSIKMIITVASGCAITLHESLKNQQVADISQFLVDITWPASLRLKVFKQRVLIHAPCTLQQLKQANAPLKLLQKIPGIELIELTEKSSCCGAAGLYMLQQTAMANTLVEQLIKQIEQHKPDIVVTSNIGCRLHLVRALTYKKLTIPVMHPVELLAAQLF